jgi:hypothetical protein
MNKNLTEIRVLTCQLFSGRDKAQSASLRGGAEAIHSN